jgi:hypothetical protein
MSSSYQKVPIASSPSAMPPTTQDPRDKKKKENRGSSAKDKKDLHKYAKKTLQKVLFLSENISFAESIMAYLDKSAVNQKLN